MPPIADADAWDQQTSVAVEPSRKSGRAARRSAHVWSLYTGSTVSPFGNLRQDGLRLRAVTAFSRFRYSGLRYDPIKGDSVLVDFKGASRTSDIFVGYQLGLRRDHGQGLCRLADRAHRHHAIRYRDHRAGAVGGAEGGARSLDQLRQPGVGVAGPQLRQGVRCVLHATSRGLACDGVHAIGPEASLVGHDESRMLRLGGFLRFDDGTNELSASAGWFTPREGDGGAYVSAQWLRRF